MMLALTSRREVILLRSLSHHCDVSEIVGELALDVRIEITNDRHVRLNIAAGHQHGAKACGLALEVYESQYKRCVGSQGNV